ncbi:MAG TPA: Rieske 2Fe-2S domain-containing protein [Gemmataceae bacterium]|nr:Rieske 2Fe-2S domain-containing protein [Gemmataceae bacterium]
MAMIDHWHPVVRSRDLGRKPVAIRLAGQSIALYRTASGAAAALADECPHRRMRLSLGAVEGDKLRCRYHGWTFTTDGQGESPGTPKLHACATAYDCREEHGAVWIKSRDSSPEFPLFEVDGYLPICLLRHTAEAPLELATDNFCEIEHTPTTHAVFGYDLARMHEVTVRFEPTDTTVRVINAGPSKPVGLLLGALVGIRRGYLFYDDWTTHFSPVYSVYDHWWAHPETGRECKVRWRLYIFFTPVDEGRTDLMTFAYAKSNWPGPAGGLRMFRWLMRWHIDKEIQLDLEILKGLASQNPSVEGMKLSRFDRVLGLNRDRIERVYRGNGLPMAATCQP